MDQFLSQLPSIGDIILVVNIIIAIFVAYGEYKRRKAQNRESEGNSVNAIANAAAKVTESSMGLLSAKDLLILDLQKKIDFLELRIDCYKELLKKNNIEDSICDD